ncbi:hypothetical protein FXO38_07891 [Capsicum annuum]|nr:hypothetical protein FXO38_07891 [Capsicum annuum]
MIGRDDIKGRKSNVAINDWLQQANYPYGNTFLTPLASNSEVGFPLSVPFLPGLAPKVLRRPLRPPTHRGLKLSPTVGFLLINNSPLGALDSVARLDKAAAGPTPKSDERFACQYHYGPLPEFPLASPRSGIVHHLLGPDRYGHTWTLLRRSRSVGDAPLGGIPPISFLTPYGFTRLLSLIHVRLLGLFFKTGRMGSHRPASVACRYRSTTEACAAFHN